MNSDLELLKPCPKLAALIFHTGSLQGRKLTEFLSPGYEEVLERISSIEPGRCELIPLRLKDSRGLGVQVHAYFSQYDADGSNHYLLGLAEVQDYGGYTRMPTIPAPPDLTSDPIAWDASGTETFAFYVGMACEEVIAVSENVLDFWDRSGPGDCLMEYFESHELRACIQNVMNKAIHMGSASMPLHRHDLILTPRLSSSPWRLVSVSASALVTGLVGETMALSIVAEPEFSCSSSNSSSSSRSSSRSMKSRSKRSVGPLARALGASTDAARSKFLDNAMNKDTRDLAAGNARFPLHL